MSKRLASLTLAAFVICSGAAFAKGGVQITVGGDVSTWTSGSPTGPGLIPIGGAGQLNGEFTIAERDGIQIGLRATDRTDGLLTASGKRKGRYEAATGFDTGTTNRAEWNYDWHVDLRGTGTTLGDYDFTLTQTFAASLFGFTGPVDLTFNGFIPDDTVLFQSSQNPLFGNDTFDVNERGTYNLKLTLKPKKGGQPLNAHIQVRVR